MRGFSLWGRQSSVCLFPLLRAVSFVCRLFVLLLLLLMPRVASSSTCRKLLEPRRTQAHITDHTQSDLGHLKTNRRTRRRRKTASTSCVPKVHANPLEAFCTTRKTTSCTRLFHALYKTHSPCSTFPYKPTPTLANMHIQMRVYGAADLPVRRTMVLMQKLREGSNRGTPRTRTSEEGRHLRNGVQTTSRSSPWGVDTLRDSLCLSSWSDDSYHQHRSASTAFRRSITLTRLLCALSSSLVVTMPTTEHTRSHLRRSFSRTPHTHAPAQTGTGVHTPPHAPVYKTRFHGPTHTQRDYLPTHPYTPPHIYTHVQKTYLYGPTYTRAAHTQAHGDAAEKRPSAFPPFGKKKEVSPCANTHTHEYTSTYVLSYPTCSHVLPLRTSQAVCISLR